MKGAGLKEKACLRFFWLFINIKLLRKFTEAPVCQRRSALWSDDFLSEVH